MHSIPIRSFLLHRPFGDIATAILATLWLVVSLQTHVLSGCQPESQPTTSGPLADFGDSWLLDLARNRKDLTRITSRPVRMERPSAQLCMSPYPAGTAHPDPHLEWAIHVYATGPGVAPMWDPYETFPVGTVLLKEKFDPRDPGHPELFTGMLKREAGFAAEEGDWEYFTLDGAITGVTARGKLRACVECHRGYRQSDFVTKQYAARSASAGSRRRVLVDGRWEDPGPTVWCGTSDTVYLPAALAGTQGPLLSRGEAAERWRAAQVAGGSLSGLPEDLSQLGGPTLRYESDPRKNTLGYWTQSGDRAWWQLQIPRGGRYEVRILQGCGAGSGGAVVQMEAAGQTCSFTVQDTGHFQNFVWRSVGELEFKDAGEVGLWVIPQSKPGVAVMDLRQVRLVLRDSREVPGSGSRKRGPE